MCILHIRAFHFQDCWPAALPLVSLQAFWLHRCSLMEECKHYCSFYAPLNVWESKSDNKNMKNMDKLVRFIHFYSIIIFNCYYFKWKINYSMLWMNFTSESCKLLIFVWVNLVLMINGGKICINQSQLNCIILLYKIWNLFQPGAWPKTDCHLWSCLNHLTFSWTSYNSGTIQ